MKLKIFKKLPHTTLLTKTIIVIVINELISLAALTQNLNRIFDIPWFVFNFVILLFCIFVFCGAIFFTIVTVFLCEIIHWFSSHPFIFIIIVCQCIVIYSLSKLIIHYHYDHPKTFVTTSLYKSLEKKVINFIIFCFLASFDLIITILYLLQLLVLISIFIYFSKRSTNILNSVIEIRNSTFIFQLSVIISLIIIRYIILKYAQKNKNQTDLFLKRYGLLTYFDNSKSLQFIIPIRYFILYSLSALIFISTILLIEPQKSLLNFAVLPIFIPSFLYYIYVLKPWLEKLNKKEKFSAVTAFILSSIFPFLALIISAFQFYFDISKK